MYYTRTAGLTVCISVHPDRKEEKKSIFILKATVLARKKKREN